MLQFLDESYPDLDAEEMLFLYQKLVSDNELEKSQSDEKARFKIAGQYFSLYPYNSQPQTPSKADE